MALLGDTGIKPYAEQELTANRIQFGNTQNQTQLLELAELRRQQASAANYRQAIANNPDILLNPGGSTLASLNAGGPPGAITQGPLPGMPGATQTIGAPQDLSQHASGPPPQSTLGGLAPAPPQDPVRALLQRDPEAGLKLLDMREKMQERTLGMQEKKMAYFGQLLQGATDQASWDQAREQVGRVDPQAAARMPQQFNKDVRDQWVQQALSVKERLTLQIAEGKNRLDAAKLRLQAANIPNYTGDATLDAAIFARMKDQPAGTQPSAEIVDAARKDVQEGKVAVSAAQGAQGAQARALGETAQKRLEAFDKAGDTAQQTHTVLDQMEALINSDAGVYGNSPEGRARMKAYEAGLAPNDQKARNTAQLRNLASNLQLAHGSLGTGVSEYDARVYAKAAGDMQNAQNVDQMKQYIAQMRPALTQAMTSANEARKSFQQTGDLPEFRRPAAPSAATGTSKGTVKLEVLADYAAKHNIPIGQAIKQAYDKGLEIQ